MSQWRRTHQILLMQKLHLHLLHYPAGLVFVAPMEVVSVVRKCRSPHPAALPKNKIRSSTWRITVRLWRADERMPARSQACSGQETSGSLSRRRTTALSRSGTSSARVSPRLLRNVPASDINNVDVRRTATTVRRRIGGRHLACMLLLFGVAFFAPCPPMLPS